MAIAQRVYRMPSGDFLVATEPDRATGWTCDADGRWEMSDGTWIEPRSFVMVNAAGELLRTYCAHRSDGLDDYLYVQDLYWVSGKQLLSSMLEYGHPSGRYGSRLCSVKVIADGLEAIEHDRLPDVAWPPLAADGAVRSSVGPDGVASTRT